MGDIHSGYLYITSSSPLLLRGTPDTARILCRSFTPKRHRQLRAKDLPKVPTWWLERESNPRPFGRQALTLPISHHALNISSLGLFSSSVVNALILQLFHIHLFEQSCLSQFLPHRNAYTNYQFIGDFADKYSFEAQDLFVTGVALKL